MRYLLGADVPSVPAHTYRATQDEVATLQGGHRGSAARAKGLVEKQTAILDNGLACLPHSVPLHLAKLAAAEKHLARDEVRITPPTACCTPT